jgi:hypothetical protein
MFTRQESKRCGFFVRARPVRVLVLEGIRPSAMLPTIDPRSVPGSNMMSNPSTVSDASARRRPPAGTISPRGTPLIVSGVSPGHPIKLYAPLFDT